MNNLLMSGIDLFEPSSFLAIQLVQKNLHAIVTAVLKVYYGLFYHLSFPLLRTLQDDI